MAKGGKIKENLKTQNGTNKGKERETSIRHISGGEKCNFRKERVGDNMVLGPMSGHLGQDTRNYV
jgi:hypothetical protein